MTEITDLSPTDAANTSISTESLEGNVANMGRMEETLQAVMGLLARSIRTNVLRFLDHTDDTKKLALDLSGLTTATTRTLTAPDADGTIALYSDLALKGYIYGLTLSNNGTDATNDIDIAAGEAASDDSVPVLIKLASGITKRLDAAWAVGTGNGGLDTGAVADGVYYVWLIQRSDTGVTDVLFSASKTSPTMPANYDRKRRFWSIVRVSSSIRAFRQTGDRCDFTPGIVEAASASISTSQQAIATSLPPEVVGLFRVRLSPGGGASFSWIISGIPISASTNDASLTASSVATAGEFHVCTDSSSEIVHRATGTVGTSTATIISYGWLDDRGRYE